MLPPRMELRIALMRAAVTAGDAMGVVSFWEYLNRWVLEEGQLRIKSLFQSKGL